MKLFPRRRTMRDRVPAPNKTLLRVIREREELREAADLLAQDLAQARAQRDEANRQRGLIGAERDGLKAGLAQAHHELERARAELANARATATNADRLLADQVRLAALPTDVVKLRHELAREREVRARQDLRWAELGEMAERTCPRPCCSGSGRS